ncbi:MAG TPA: DUF5680 domain-containing protein [Candidatus Saccharibacteria bacterium]|nr:DUF5680 domain-containing protein [Candidatus Saccharibacteria bacterium]
MDYQLEQFLLSANIRGYGSDDVNQETLPNGEHTILFSKDTFVFKDVYYGGEPYAGQEVIFRRDGQAIWAMQYRGEVKGDDFSEVYSFLGKVLTNTKLGLPRGVDGYRDGELSYNFHMDGSLENFTAEEKILHSDTIVYSAKFFGGLVDTRKGTI